MIQETGEYVINLTTEKLAWATDFCGVRSGRDMDKFKEMKLTPGTGRTRVCADGRRKSRIHRMPGHQCDGIGQS